MLFHLIYGSAWVFQPIADSARNVSWSSTKPWPMWVNAAFTSEGAPCPKTLRCSSFICTANSFSTCWTIVFLRFCAPGPVPEDIHFWALLRALLHQDNASSILLLIAADRGSAPVVTKLWLKLEAWFPAMSGNVNAPDRKNGQQWFERKSSHRKQKRKGCISPALDVGGGISCNVGGCEGPGKCESSPVQAGNSTTVQTHWLWCYHCPER